MTSQDVYTAMGRNLNRIREYNDLTVPPKNSGRGGLDFYCAQSSGWETQWQEFIVEKDPYALRMDKLFQDLVVAAGELCPVS